MSKLVYLVVLIMLASVAAAIYFDDLIIRVISGVIFVVGAVFVYYQVADTTDDHDGSADEADAPPADYRYDPSPGTEQQAPDDPGQPATAARAVSRHARPQRYQNPAEIPEELYKTVAILPQDGDPRGEFDQVTRRLLDVLKEHLLAHTVALFWINHERGQIVFGEFATDSAAYTGVRRMQLGTDLVSLIGKSGRPQVLSDIGSATEPDMLPYYDAKEGIQSFAGVPMYFDDECIAVLTVDSKAPDSFGIETVAIMGKFTALIAHVLAGYTQKFDLAAEAKLSSIIRSLQRETIAHFDSYGIAGALSNAVISILDWDFYAVVMQQSKAKNWVVVRSRAKAANLPYVSEGVTVEIDGSILRPVVDSVQAQILPAPKSSEYRFYMKEAIASAGQLCVVPFAFNTNTPAMLIVEYREQNQYGARDLSTAVFLADIAAMHLEIFQLRETARKNLLVEEALQVGSRPYFMQRLHEEYRRCAVTGEQAVFCTIALDSVDELLQKYGDDGIDVVLADVAKILRGSLQAFDVIGRWDRARFGVLLIHTSAEDAYLRGEKMRKAIAGHVSMYGGISFSISVSIAGCTFSSAMDLDDIMSVCNQAMDRALADGGNCVKVV